MADMIPVETNSTGTTQTEIKETNPSFLPSAVAHSLGNGIYQSLQPSLQEMQKGVKSLKFIEDIDQKYVTSVNDAIVTTTNFLRSLRRAKEVPIVPMHGESWDFKNPIEEFEDEPQLPLGEQTLGEDIAKKVLAALNHNLGNKINPLGNAEVIGWRTKNIDAKAIADTMTVAYKQIIKRLKSILPPDADDLKIITDEKGNTTITPITP